MHVTVYMSISLGVDPSVHVMHLPIIMPVHAPASTHRDSCRLVMISEIPICFSTLSVCAELGL